MCPCVHICVCVCCTLFGLCMCGEREYAFEMHDGIATAPSAALEGVHAHVLETVHVRGFSNWKERKKRCSFRFHLLFFFPSLSYFSFSALWPQFFFRLPTHTRVDVTPPNPKLAMSRVRSISHFSRTRALPCLFILRESPSPPIFRRSLTTSRFWRKALRNLAVISHPSSPETRATHTPMDHRSWLMGILR